jgi:hypothetical protein
MTMKKLIIALLLALLPGLAFAQTAIKQPYFIATSAWVDFGNGPLEILPIEGNGNLYSRGSTGVGSTSGSSTALTLTAIPTYPPCVGCVISGTGITAGTTVSATSGTSVTLSAAMTVASSTVLAWGVACPTSGTPPTNASISAPINMRATASTTRFPVYSSARLCGYGGQQGGVSVLAFPIGSW